VIEAGTDAGKVTDAVAVRILQRPGIDLIDDAAFPPGCLEGRGMDLHGDLLERRPLRSGAASEP
jgi:hypothetical protein